MKKFRFFAVVIAFGTLMSPAFGEASNPVRQTVSLNGDWSFQREGTKTNEWKTIQVPSSFEQHEGVKFDGVGWYRKVISPLNVPPGKRVVLHFQAAATEAEVWFDGKKVGTHLGGWTPFRFDVTDLVRGTPADQQHEIRVRLDEKVGHNSQGFLPIIAPHFGGLWQDVQLLLVPETYCDDLNVMAIGDVARSELRIQIPISGTIPSTMPAVSVRVRLRGETDWTVLPLKANFAAGRIEGSATVNNPKLWSPEEPNLYEIEVVLGADGDCIRKRTAFRSLEVYGPQLRLNGKPLQIHGLLNWGYSAPLTAPNPGEAVWRQEIEFARAHGFNLMKFCLWIPPQRYYELADEMGMLTWSEYPTWHPNLTQKYLEPLRHEFTEFFNNDRNHPSVVLRSLTCETGPGAELPVIQNLYDLPKNSIPGALVEDDSSWIGWNRVNDFFDDHPYGNNDTWVKTLQEFNEYILAHGLKPMVLGESISADTWIDRDAIVNRLGAERPWWAPGPIDEAPKWVTQMRAAAGQGGLDQLRADSLRYGMLMRKYQIETYRREIPAGGYVISVIRDIPTASMGLLDYLGNSKWTEADWAWQRDTMCLLKTESDRRSFTGGEHLNAEILLSHFGRETINNGQLEVTLTSESNPTEVLQKLEEKDIQQIPGTLARRMDLDWPLPAVTSPRHFVVRAALRAGTNWFKNEWPLWVVPAMSTQAVAQVRLHSSVSDETARELFPGAVRFDTNDPQGVIVAARFDNDLMRTLENGGRVLLLPDGKKSSFPLQSHWFLRGAPYIPDHALSRSIPRDLLLELQHFDLSSPVVPDIKYIESIDPILMLWDTHDLRTVKTHGLIFETRVGKGRLLVSAIRHAGAQNAAGRWLLGELVDHLNSSAAPRNGLSEEMWAWEKKRANAELTNLVACTWRFRPDPKNEGLSQGWQKAQLKSEEGWNPIRIGTAWESQGYPTLDGWAWYRLAIDIPTRWKDQQVFLSFEGVDDMYELFINGEFAGKSGDLATRKDSFNEKKSYDITRLVRPGEKAAIVVRVYDWGGAGGIFRPVTLGTVGFGSEVTILK